jgi:hypothetical protein
MADYIAIQTKRFDCQKGIHVQSFDLPEAMIALLKREAPLDVWWVSESPEPGMYQIASRVRYTDYRLSRGTQFESWALTPDPAASFRLEGGFLAAPVVQISPEIFKGRYSPLSPELRAKLVKALDSLFGVTISPRRLGVALDDLPLVSKEDMDHARRDLADLLRRPLTSGYFKIKEEFYGKLSGIGCALFDVLERKGKGFAASFAIAAAADPLRAAFQASQNVEKDPRRFRPLTLEGIMARGFSDPAAPLTGVDKTREAEEMHQAIVRSLFTVMERDGRFSLFDSEFIDIGLFEHANLADPRHVIEVKSLTADNLETQVEKGVIQLARSRYHFGSQGVRYHLVLQDIGLAVPDWLMSIASTFGISVHMIDVSVQGEESCPTFYCSL